MGSITNNIIHNRSSPILGEKCRSINTFGDSCYNGKFNTGSKSYKIFCHMFPVLKKNSVVEPEPQGAETFGRSRSWSQYSEVLASASAPGSGLD